MPKMKLAIFTLLISLILSFASYADGEKSPAADADKTKPREFITHHKMQIRNETLSYTAVAGETIVENAEGEQEAAIFCISYFKEGANPQERPIVFLFNGGPGSSSVWLHLGAFGPQRIDWPQNADNPGAPPYRMVDNPNTLLRYADLVFVDPVGTGYSHALGKKKNKDFWGVDEDSAVLADFIRRYLGTNKRWNSPKYLAGESYGTLRASVLIRDLQLKLLNTVSFNGVVFISCATDVRIFLNAGPGNELPYVTDLPTFAATAYYHKALPQQPADLNSFLRTVEEFARTEYLTALFKGDASSANEQQAITEKLHQFTGLSVDYLKRCHNRIDRDRFLKELLRNRGITLAVHDTRFTGKDPDEAGEGVELDPFLFGMSGPFIAEINEYLTNRLSVKVKEPYVVFAVGAGEAWKRAGDGNQVFAGFLNTTGYLRQAAATNKDFRVFVASGLHDLTTTYYGTQYVFENSGIDRKRLTLKTYFGGHMMYLVPESGRQLSADIGAFLNAK